MRSTMLTSRSRTRCARALVALPAAAALTLALAACGADEDEQGAGDGSSAVAGGAGDGGASGAGAKGEGAEARGADNEDIANSSHYVDEGEIGDEKAQREGNDPDAAGSPEDAAGLDNASLILTEVDFPGWTYQGVNPSDGVAAAQQLTEAMKNLDVDPPECSDVAVGSPEIPEGAAAAQVQDPKTQSVYSIMVMGTGVDRGEFSDRFLRCPAFTLTGNGLTMEAKNSPAATPRIDRANVQGFNSTATSRVDALGQEQSQTQTFYQVTTRGITFRVSALQMTPQPDDATIGALGDIAGRQADKIKNA
ncbi:hypothetical protein [Dietzia timorensis]|uniref:DUF5642 domain-containing protein n=1 Tax=Dietzia timorensis TaxID=499555 RepID=A0A173LR80_9ACTN|nr:hypothetical protein [Dietzia timorensis]ANI93452.1 Hypothetical protein BJL86_2692 [Dietzia timorensis]